MPNLENHSMDFSSKGVRPRRPYIRMGFAMRFAERCVDRSNWMQKAKWRRER